MNDGRCESWGSCQAWSMSSMLDALPVSPSSICSSSSCPVNPRSCSPSSFYTTKDKSICSMVNDANKIPPISIAEHDEGIDDENHLFDFDQFKFMINNPSEDQDGKQNDSPKCSGFSSECESFNTGLDHTVCSKPLLIHEEEDERENDTAESSDGMYEIPADAESPVTGHHRLTTRLIPYHEFLDEIKKKEFRDKVNAWKEAQHLKLMNRLVTKEAATNAWELEQINKAKEKLNKLEMKLEKKRVKALEKMQMKISRVQRKAEKKKTKERQSTAKKASRIKTISDKVKATKCLIWVKLLSLY